MMSSLVSNQTHVKDYNNDGNSLLSLPSPRDGRMEKEVHDEGTAYDDLSDCVLIDDDTNGDIDEIIGLIHSRNHNDLERYLDTYQGVNLDAYSPTNPSINPVISACICGALTCLKLLVKYGANLAILTRDGYPPIFYAIKYRQFDLAIELIKTYSGTQSLTSVYVDSDKNDMLLMCAKHMYMEQSNQYITKTGLQLFELLLLNGSFAASHKNHQGKTIELYALQHKMDALVKILLYSTPRRRLNLNQWLNEKILFFIHEKNAVGLHEFFQLCLNKLSISPSAIEHSINKVNSHGLSALHAITLTGSPQLLDTALTFGGDLVGCITPDQRSLLMFILDTLCRNLRRIHSNGSPSLQGQQGSTIEMDISPYTRPSKDTHVYNKAEPYSSHLQLPMEPLSPTQHREVVEPIMTMFHHLLTKYHELCQQIIPIRDVDNHTVIHYMLRLELIDIIPIDLVKQVIGLSPIATFCHITHNTLLMDLVGQDAIYYTQVQLYQKHLECICQADEERDVHTGSIARHETAGAVIEASPSTTTTAAATTTINTTTTSIQQHTAMRTASDEKGLFNLLQVRKCLAFYQHVVQVRSELIHWLAHQSYGKLGQFNRAGWCVFDMLVSQGSEISLFNSDDIITLLLNLYIERDLLDISHHNTGSLWDKAKFMKQTRKIQLLEAYNQTSHISTVTKDSVILAATKVSKSHSISEVYQQLLLPLYLRPSQ